MEGAAAASIDNFKSVTESSHKTSEINKIRRFQTGGKGGEDAAWFGAVQPATCSPFFLDCPMPPADAPPPLLRAFACEGPDLAFAHSAYLSVGKFNEPRGTERSGKSFELGLLRLANS